MMNREILFRGKCIKNGAWVEGCLVRGKDYLYETEMTTIFSTDTIFYPRTETLGYDRVISDTVGQFTGLCDKNGKKIFEDDIVVYFKAEDLDTEHAVVVFDDGKFKLKYVYGYLDDELDSVTAETLIVIGNIHDNHELAEKNRYDQDE